MKYVRLCLFLAVVVFVWIAFGFEVNAFQLPGAGSSSIDTRLRVPSADPRQTPQLPILAQPAFDHVTLDGGILGDLSRNAALQIPTTRISPAPFIPPAACSDPFVQRDVLQASKPLAEPIAAFLPPPPPAKP